MASAVSPQIVVVGTGLAGFAVLRELRRLSPQAHLVVVTVEDGHFYSKPALSTALAKGKDAATLVTSPAEKMVAQLGLDMRPGRIAETIDRTSKVLCTTGGPIAYDALILATGASPFRAHIAGDAAHRAISINKLEDYAYFREQLPPPGARALVIGAGLVGTEFANDLVTSGYRPIVVDLLRHPLGQLVPEAVGTKVEAALAAAGVEWHLGRTMMSLDYAVPGPGYVATLDDGTRIDADIMISALGIRPDIALADEAGLETDFGIKVDDCGRTSDPAIYAIGDCAEYRHGPAAYVTPIMAAARGIAPSALGTPTPIVFPPLSVQVKTTLLPINLLPPRRGTAGEWRRLEDGEEGSRFVYVDLDSIVRGYVLTGRLCERRLEMDRMVGQPGELEVVA